jgi:DNA-binding beta-propeller fold protein YncE
VGRVLSAHGSRWVVSGAEERAKAAGDPLAALQGLLEPAFSRDDLTVYRVLLGPRLTPVLARKTTSATVAAFEPPQGDATLSEPRGVAIAPDGRIWVADFGNDRLVRFEPDLRSPVVLGRRGSGRLQFQQPSAVAIGRDGRVYVADTWNSRVQVLSPDGAWLEERNADLYGPRGVAVDAKGRVFVSDTGRGRVVRFGVNGAVDKTWGQSGPERERLRGPVGIAVSPAGDVWVCDNDGGRLCRFDSDGRFLSAVPVPGWRQEVYSEPHVALDAEGRVWVSVPLSGELRQLTAEGVTEAKRRTPEVNGERPRVTGFAFAPVTGRALAAGLDGKLYWLRGRPTIER